MIRPFYYDDDDDDGDDEYGDDDIETEIYTGWQCWWKYLYSDLEQWNQGSCCVFVQSGQDDDSSLDQHLNYKLHIRYSPLTLRI